MFSMLSTIDALALRALCAVQSRARCARTRERGQATTEYVLVLLGVAAIAVAVVAWATKSGKVGQLLDRVFDHIAGQVG